ncbi:TetR/AcrR family transcriptional regulator [Magnetofaba australis]|uniref:TetR/AcrR family transcriptional regulator n=1 Tax=Magnetofaba australis TaxID=1472297 RepID=UPI001301E986|nr:TetR/AcrR family transcriptional regulator [Magnetofaba australis]
MTEAQKKSADATREKLLQAAYEEIHLHGFQAASLSAILKRAQMTKGALYHHFPNKLALGYAVVEEVLQEEFERDFFQYFRQKDNFIDGFLYAAEKGRDARQADLVQRGCPVNNLIHEMSPIDPGFSTRLDAIISWAVEMFESQLRIDQQKGLIRADIDPHCTALFIVAGMKGCVGLAKNVQSAERFNQCVFALIQYVQMLRA